MRAFAAAMLFVTACGSSHAAPPVLGAVAPFELTDQAGAPFGARELAGKPFIANFIFTRCTSVCPVFTEKMAALQDRTKTRLVSFSVDPEYDQPPVLLAYAQVHHADLSRWSFLTGDIEQIKKTVVDGMKVAIERRPDQPIGMSILHGKHFVLVDGDLKIRGYYDSSDPEAVERLVADAAALERSK